MMQDNAHMLAKDGQNAKNLPNVGPETGIMMPITVYRPVACHYGPRYRQREEEPT